jgi:hypothetical protein
MYLFLNCIQILSACIVWVQNKEFDVTGRLAIVNTQYRVSQHTTA